MSEWPVGFPPPFHIQDVLPRSADGSQGPPPMQDDDKPPRTDGKRDSQPTPQGPKTEGDAGPLGVAVREDDHGPA